MIFLFVGVFGETSTNTSQARQIDRCFFKHDDVYVKEYPYRQIAASIGNEARDQDLIDKINELKPKCVLFSKCNKVSVRVCEAANKVTKTILWYMDSLNSNWNSELLEKIKTCNAVACALHRPYEEALKYNKNSFFVPEGFDEDTDVPMQHLQKIYDVVFIGAINQERARYKSGYPFQVISAWGKDHAKVVSQSRINLNFVRCDSGCSDRVYKVLAAGGFLMTEPWPEMEKLFTVGKDLVVFNNPTELKEKIDYYLSHKEEREAIAKAGNIRVQDYTRKKWAQKIMKILRELP